MSISSKIKKTITMAGLLAVSAAAVAAEPIKTHEEALEKLTGPAQAKTGKLSAICVSVTPYFVASLSPTGAVSSFFSLQIDGATQYSKPQGKCSYPEANGLCKRGLIKITSTAPIACSVPIGL